MRYIGAHVSISGGVQTAPERASELEANALGMFTKNQRQWNAKDLTEEEIDAFSSALRASGISQEKVVIHASYLINVGNPDAEKHDKSLAALLDECRRAEQLGLTLVNFHPGSGMKELSEAETVKRIGEACREVLDQTETAIPVLEVTAGQGAHVGYRFSHIAGIIDAAGAPTRIAACIDSCHIYAAGYDVRTPEGYAEAMDEFESEVGWDRLVGLHLNDSMTELGSRRDRHERVGMGEIGIAGLANFIRDERLADLPFVLETTDPDIWKEEIALLRGIADGSIDPDSATPPAEEAEDKGKKKGGKSGS